MTDGAVAASQASANLASANPAGLAVDLADLLTLAAALAVGAMVAIAVGRLMVLVGPRDRPDGGHKAHGRVTPSGGGIAILAGGASTVLAAHAGGLMLATTAFWSMAAAAVLAAALGLADDIRHLDARTKLVIQAGLAVGLVLVAGLQAPLVVLGIGDLRPLPERPLWLAALSVTGSVLWLLVCSNAVNFQDGANGLAMGSGGISLCGMAGLAALAGGPLDVIVLLLGLGAGCGGFLVWNVPAGRLFAGDTGSLAVGFALGTGGLVLARLGVNELLVALCLLPMLADVILTVVWRIRHDGGVRVLTRPHRHHLYQWMIRSGVPVRRVARLWWGKSAACCALAVALHGLAGLLPPALAAALTAGVFAAVAALFAVLSRRWRRQHQDAVS